MRFSVVVPAYNEEALLPATLAAVREAAALGFGPADGWELVVCDNNSTDRTAAIAAEAGARVVFEPHNQIGRARNAGAAAARGEWLVFVDADSTPTAGLFADLRAAVDAGDCLAGGSTIAPAGDSRLFRGAVRAWNAVSRAGGWAAGSFLFCEAEAFRALGGFSAELYAAEELEFMRRARRLARTRGRRIVILHRHPLRTSDRKAHLYSWREHIALLARTLVRPSRTLGSAERCHTWYDGRR